MMADRVRQPCIWSDPRSTHQFGRREGNDPHNRLALVGAIGHSGPTPERERREYPPVGIATKTSISD